MIAGSVPDSRVHSPTVRGVAHHRGVAPTHAQISMLAGGWGRSRGGNGDNTLHGKGNDDNLHGGLGADVMFGEDGNDSLFGEADVDYAGGGIGTDACSAELVFACE